MKFAAVQMDCVFADVEANLDRAETFVRQSRQKGADLVLLPEFFPSAIGFSPQMSPVALQGEQVRERMRRLSADSGMIIGGSYLIFNGQDAYNTFDLVFPNGDIFSHRKDIPTQFENCYYTGGDTEHILHTPIGEIGIALCWEMMRYDTVKRMSGKVDLVLAGSCWWDLPTDAPAGREPLREYNQKLAAETPATFAKLLHVPLIHANHCGQVTACRFPSGDRQQTRQLVGAAQIINAEGNVIGRRSFREGAGIVAAELPLEKARQTRKSADIGTDRRWIPDLPDSYLEAWNKMNPLGSDYYKAKIRPFYREQFMENRPENC
ncbi:MAG: carbon-nitrogen hydrolase family protein [Clostridiaceae bacterium]|nr:carbon-nitrogen hydrolase family protein [Clostridiaceae bacterium]